MLFQRKLDFQGERSHFGNRIMAECFRQSYLVSKSPPKKTPFSNRRNREFLYLAEVDAIIAATQKTRCSIRNQAVALLLFCQALQPAELCWLRWCDVNFAEKNLFVTRNRPKTIRYQTQVVVNLQPLCPPEVDILSQLYEQRTGDWLFASERQKRLSSRSLHHLIQQAGKLLEKEKANTLPDLPSLVHPYMLRRSGLFYRGALLLKPLGLSLRQCCLLWNLYQTSIPFSASDEQEYRMISLAQESAFLAALERIKAFSGIKVYENVIDYLLGAFSMFPRLKEIPPSYWLAPTRWQQ